MTEKEIKDWKGMMEEIFFLQYHLGMTGAVAFDIPTCERKRLVDEFLSRRW